MADPPGLLGDMREAWASPTRLSVAVSTFVDKARIWNKNVFKILFHRKKRVLARLGGIQTTMSINPNSFLVDLERDLRTKYHEIAKVGGVLGDEIPYNLAGGSG